MADDRRYSSPTKIKAAAVWALTSLLTAMFASGVAPVVVMPVAVGALVFLCLRDVEQVIRGGEEAGGGQCCHCALAKVGLAVVTCNAAVDAYDDDDDARRDPGSAAALVFVSYAGLVILTGLFVRAFARGHAGEHGQRG